MVDKKPQTQLNEYKYAISILSGAILITIVLIFLIGKPLFTSIQETSKEVEDKQLTVTKLEEKLANLKNLEYKEAELTEQNKTVLAALPEGKNVSRLFVQFESIFNESGASISSVSESRSASQETGSEVIKPVTYQVTGKVNDYASLKEALKKMETALRILSIESIRITGEGSDLSTSFTINTYTRGQQ